MCSVRKQKRQTLHTFVDLGVIMVPAMLKVLTIIPLHLLSAVAYWAVVASNGVEWLYLPVMAMTLPSTADLVLTGADFSIMWAVLFLLIEAIKASQTGWTSIVNHGLSSLLFLVAFALFMTIPMFGTPAWLVITSMMFVDMIAGWSITALSARRDVALGGF